jgi:Transcriptional regulatory protein, C terminal
MYEALYRPSGTTLDTCMPRGGPPVTQRTSGLALLEADGSLVTKDELLGRVWPGIVVAEENLKTQISALRKALGADRDFIQTDFGRGYRFTGVARSNPAADRCKHPTRAKLRPDRTFLPRECWQSLRYSVGRTN